MEEGFKSESNGSDINYGDLAEANAMKVPFF